MENAKNLYQKFSAIEINSTEGACTTSDLKQIFGAVVDNSDTDIDSANSDTDIDSDIGDTDLDSDIGDADIDSANSDADSDNSSCDSLYRIDSMPNFSCNIQREFLDSFSFDFWDNKRSVSIFEERSSEYNRLIQSVISANLVPNTQNTYRNYAFIAGDYFLKYKPECFIDQNDYENTIKTQKVDIFVQYLNPKNAFSQSYFGLKKCLLTSIRDEYYPLFEHAYKDHIWRAFESPNSAIRVHVICIPCEKFLSKFTFYPCQLAYKYNTRELIASDWFINGGPITNGDGSIWSCDRQNDDSKTKQLLSKKGISQDNFTFDNRVIESFHF